jgi:hypothetical protein
MSCGSWTVWSVPMSGGALFRSLIRENWRHAHRARAGVGLWGEVSRIDNRTEEERCPSSGLLIFGI